MIEVTLRFHLPLFAICLIAISACTSDEPRILVLDDGRQIELESDASRKARLATIRKEVAGVWKTRQNMTYQGNPYEIAVHPDRQKAYIAPRNDGFAFGPSELEQVAKAHTGCSATHNIGILSTVGASKGTLNYQGVKAKTAGIKAFSVQLDC